MSAVVVISVMYLDDIRLNQVVLIVIYERRKLKRESPYRLFMSFETEMDEVAARR